MRLTTILKAYLTKKLCLYSFKLLHTIKLGIAQGKLSLVG
jgi:hypothetical protein